MAKAEKAAPGKGGARNLIILIVVALIASGAGFAVPFFLNAGASEKTAKKEEKKSDETEIGYAFVSFGEDVIVNPNEERHQRYLRVKLTFLVDPANEKAVKDQVEKQRPRLKNWLLSYLMDKTMKDVTGAAGVNRARREIQDHFNDVLFPDGSEKIREVLFTEFNFQ